MIKLQKLLRSKKGFTLVEIIVVLVILAILAAIAIPAMTGYVDKANGATALAEGRAAYIAAQTLASEEYGKTAPNYATAVTSDTIKALAGGLTGTITVAVTAGKVTSLTYARLGYTATFPAATVAKTTTP